MMIKLSLILIRLLNHENHVHFSELLVQLLNQFKTHGMKFKKIIKNMKKLFKLFNIFIINLLKNSRKKTINLVTN